jgi:Tol biopolymer transport system component
LAGFLCALFLIRTSCADVIVTQGTNFGVDVFPGDGRVAMDLLGKVWVLPARGGQARMMTDGLLPARQPRWSPDGSQILYQSNSPDEASLWLLEVESSAVSRIGNGSFFNQHASWHPDGARIVFSSQRRDSGFDIWETDLPTGLSWRVSSHPGDEIEPVWSRDGRHLAYIRRNDGSYTLVLRRHGQAEVDLLTSDQPLSSPSWRPDGTLLTVLRQDGDELSIYIVILAEPTLTRQFIAGEDFFAAPVTWRNRHEMLYTADGIIKTRGFADLRSAALPFRAALQEPETRPKTVIAKRDLELVDPPTDRLVIRSARLYDGIWNRYRERMDVLIDSGRIVEVVARREWPDVTVLDLGDVAVLPGFIDLWSAMPTGPGEQSGPGMLAYGVTTIVTDDTSDIDKLWEGEQSPGPRVLAANNIGIPTEQDAGQPYFFIKVPARDAADDTTREAVQNWQAQGVPILAESWNTGLEIGADLLVGAGSLPSSPVGGQYQDMQVAVPQGPLTLISGLADGGTPGISSLLNSRQARELGHGKSPGRRFSSVPALASSPASILLGSKPNGLPPGLALHAELRALAAAGLPGERMLQATGSGAAAILGLDNQIGRITPGALADLVLVNGDPLNNAADALSIVAVVRNGRFFSLVGLLERATAAIDVE